MCFQTQTFYRCKCPPLSPLNTPCAEHPTCQRITKHQRCVDGACPACRRTPIHLPCPFVPANLPHTERSFLPQAPVPKRREKVEQWLDRYHPLASSVERVSVENGVGGTMASSRYATGGGRLAAAGTRDGKSSGAAAAAAGIAGRKKVLTVEEMLNPAHGRTGAQGKASRPAR